MRIGQAIPEDRECFKLSIRWTDFIYDTDEAAFTSVLQKCTTKPWSFDKSGEDVDENNPNAVKISLKIGLTQDELDTTRDTLFDIFEKAYARYQLTQKNPDSFFRFNITNEILFPDKIVGFVIGRQGQTLWSIKQKTGVDILFVDDLRGGFNKPPPEGYARLIIKGTSVRPVREARESVKTLFEAANNILRRNDNATVGDRMEHVDYRKTLKRAASVESVIELDSKFSAPVYPSAGLFTDKDRKFLRPMPSNSADEQSPVRNKPTGRQHQQTSVSSRLMEKNSCSSTTKITSSGTTGTIGGFGRSRFRQPDTPMPQVSSHSQQQSKTSSKFDTHTKTSGLQQRGYDNDSDRIDEIHSINNDDDEDDDVLTPPKKHRNEYEVSADERSRTNDNVPTEVKESITSFIKQSQKTAQLISDCWIENENALVNKSRRLEIENRRLSSENRHLKSELFKYKERRHDRNPRNRMDMDMMHREDR